MTERSTLSPLKYYKAIRNKLDLNYKLLHRKYSLYWKVDILPDFQFFSVFVHEDLQWGLYMTIYLNKKYPVQPSLSFRWPATWKLEPGNCCCISVAWWIIYYPCYWIIESPTGAGNKKTISPALMKHWLLVPGDAGRKLSLAESSINIRISQARNENPTTLHPASVDFYHLKMFYKMKVNDKACLVNTVSNIEHNTISASNFQN